MASQSLYRKWRSQTFSDLIGQEAVVRTLLNAVRDGRLAHAYLFCGPRGTGKTSTARLLAKALNCANPQNGEPCNECVSCREITGGHSPDVIEIDAASNNSVEDIRELRSNVNLMGGSRYRVYVIDECHMLSGAAFNALLKTLEEPPPHVIFVLATTEAHKVLPTIVSRCQRFDFRRISTRDIVARLHHVARGEGLELEPGVAELLARAAQGGMRDALSLLDQAVAFCGSRIDLEGTRRMLGLADPAALRALIECVADERAGEGLHLLNDLVVAGADLRQLSAQYAEEWRALMLARAGADVAAMLDRTEDDARALKALADRFSMEELTACARLFARNEPPVRGLPVPQLALELSFLECIAIRARGGATPAVEPRPAVGRREVAAASASSAVPPSPHSSQPAPYDTSPRQEPVTAARPSRAPAAPPEVEELDLDTLDGVAPAAYVAPTPVPAAPPPAETVATPVRTEPEQRPEPEPVRQPPTVSGNQLDVLAEVQRKWTLVKKVCRQKSPSVAGLLNNAAPVAVEGGEPPMLIIKADYKFHLEKLREPEKRECVEWAVAQVMESPWRVRLVLEADAPKPGATIPPRGRAAKPPAAPEPPSGAMPENVVPFRPSSNGAHPTSQPPASSLNGSYGSNGSAPAQNGATAAPSPAAPTPSGGSPSREQLEREVRADPLVQELMRLSGAELAEVEPLDDADDTL